MVVTTFIIGFLGIPGTISHPPLARATYNTIELIKRQIGSYMIQVSESKLWSISRCRQGYTNLDI